MKKQHLSASTKDETEAIRVKLKVLRREVKLCDDIETDSRALDEKRAALRQMEAAVSKNRNPPIYSDPPRTAAGFLIYGGDHYVQRRRSR